jgi:hypothetical protein
MGRLAIGSAVAAVLGLAATGALAVSSTTGTWAVITAGAIATSCTAMVQESAGRLSGTVKCPTLGMVMPVAGRVTGTRADGATQDGVSWTAERDGERFVGSYTSPLGLGTWVASRAD